MRLATMKIGMLHWNMVMLEFNFDYLFFY